MLRGCCQESLIPGGCIAATETVLLRVMSIQEIEKVIQGLSRQEVEELQGWIQDYLEDERELTDGFKASIERGRQDIAQGRIRVR